MRASFKGITRVLLACALVAALACTPCAFADNSSSSNTSSDSSQNQNDSSSVQGDGSTSGKVTSSDTDSSSTKASEEVAKARAKVATGDATQEEDEAQPEALDSEGNKVDDGQISDNSFLYDAAIADLAGADSYYDKQTVQVSGEVVGEAIAVTGDADHAWIVLRDPSSGSTVTVYVRQSDLRKIDTYGAYGKTGTTLRVQGTYNLACSEHEGESDVHAQVTTAVKTGSVHADQFNIEDFFPGLVAVGIGILLALVYWRVRERSR